MDTQKDGVVLHVDDGDPAKGSAVARNIRNLLGDLGPDTPVELVAHGPGLTHVLAASPLNGEIVDLLAAGVLVSACENTMARLGVQRDALAPGVGTVTAGLAQVVRRQREGWAYVRP